MSFPIETRVHVRFADIDWMGHVNHAKYFTYFEQARIAFCQGYPEFDFTKPGGPGNPSFILANAQANFLNPARIDEWLIVGARIREVKRSSFIMEYEIREEKSQRVVATGETVQVYFDYVAQKSVAIPDEMRGELEKYRA